MCLIKLKQEDDYDVYPVRRRERVVHTDRVRVSNSRRSSQIIALPTAPPPPAAVQAPSGYAVPAPQPVPVFVQPKPKPPPPPDIQYVHVSPRSSSSGHSDDRGDYHYERREVRYERDHSPPRSPREDHYEYRYIDAPRPLEPEYPYERRQRSRSRRRSRSRSRSRGDYYDDETTRIKIRREH